VERPAGRTVPEGTTGPPRGGGGDSLAAIVTAGLARSRSFNASAASSTSIHTSTACIRMGYSWRMRGSGSRSYPCRRRWTGRFGSWRRALPSASALWPGVAWPKRKTGRPGIPTRTRLCWPQTRTRFTCRDHGCCPAWRHPYSKPASRSARRWTASPSTRPVESRQRIARVWNASAAMACGPRSPLSAWVSIRTAKCGIWLS
jgi:hypothetical protein